MKNKCKSLAFWFSSLKQRKELSTICVHENSVPIVGATALIFLGKWQRTWSCRLGRASILVCSEMSPQRWRGLQTANTSHRPEGCEVQGHGAGRCGIRWGLLPYRQPLPIVTSHGRKKGRSSLESFFLKDITPRHEDSISWPNPFTKAPAPNTTTVGVRNSTCEFCGGTKTFILWHWAQLPHWDCY